MATGSEQKYTEICFFRKADLWSNCCYRPPTKWREGNVFTPVCQSFCSWGVSLYDVTSCLTALSHVPSGGSLCLVQCTFWWPLWRGVSAKGDFCEGGLCESGALWRESLWQGTICERAVFVKGVVSVKGVSVKGGGSMLGMEIPQYWHLLVATEASSTHPTGMYSCVNVWIWVDTETFSNDLNLQSCNVFQPNLAYHLTTSKYDYVIKSNLRRLTSRHSN